MNTREHIVVDAMVCIWLFFVLVPTYFPDAFSWVVANNKGLSFLGWCFVLALMICTWLGLAVILRARGWKKNFATLVAISVAICIGLVIAMSWGVTFLANVFFGSKLGFIGFMAAILYPGCFLIGLLCFDVGVGIFRKFKNLIYK